jgi:hypothetical protein
LDRWPKNPRKKVMNTATSILDFDDPTYNPFLMEETAYGVRRGVFM